MEPFVRCVYALAILIIPAIQWYLARVLKSARAHLPPGPRGHWLFGFKSPRLQPWRVYATWKKMYNSSISSFRFLHRRTVIINDAQAAMELLNNRASNYSDRPTSWMYHEICGRKNSVFNISSLDPRHAQYRRILHSGLGRTSTESYLPIMLAQMNVLVAGLSDTPKDYQKHLRRNAVAVIMKVAYGYDVVESDPFIAVAEEAAKISGWALQQGRWLVDYFPLLRFVPSSAPGAGWKRQGETWKRRLYALSDIPHLWVKSQIMSGHYDESFSSRLLRPDGTELVDPEQEDIIKWCAGGLYAGAVDTTLSALMSFVHLMAVYPQFQRIAQQEIDRVAGDGGADDLRLPNACHLRHLPYLTALIKETLRFAPVSNLALPHKAVQADVYNGHYIPAGATVMPNVWAIMRDPDLYPDPDTFNPGRFYSQDQETPASVQTDPRIYAFGFGRRRCPGLHFAETSMMMTMAGILAKFDISLPAGDSRPQEFEFTTGITSHIKPFDIVITPRQPAN